MDFCTVCLFPFSTNLEQGIEYCNRNHVQECILFLREKLLLSFHTCVIVASFIANNMELIPEQLNILSRNTLLFSLVPIFPGSKVKFAFRWQVCISTRSKHFLIQFRLILCLFCFVLFFLGGGGKGGTRLSRYRCLSLRLFLFFFSVFLSSDIFGLSSSFFAMKPCLANFSGKHQFGKKTERIFSYATLAELSKSIQNQTYFWFSVSHHIKIKIVLQFNYRIWEKKGSKYAKTRAKIEVIAIFLERYMRRNFLPMNFVWRRHTAAHPDGHQTWPTETNRNARHRVLLRTKAWIYLSRSLRTLNTFFKIHSQN